MTVSASTALAALAAYVIDKARSEGCVCEPEVLLTETRPSVYSASVAHDDFCPRLRVELERRRAR